jgi:plastocyanin
MNRTNQIVHAIIVIVLIIFCVMANIQYYAAFSQAVPKTYTIIISAGSGNKTSSLSKYFDPTTIFIHKGDTIRWINQDQMNHSVIALSINSGIIRPQGSRNGPSSFTHEFNQEGTYIYIDKLHPYMGGVVYVDVPTTQRELVSTTGSLVKVDVEMPQNAAYENNYGPFFIPANVQITAGSTLTWTNKDYVAHTATSSDGFSFDTKTIIPNDSISLSMRNKGFFTYYCKIHPWMIGTITVS